MKNLIVTCILPLSIVLSYAGTAMGESGCKIVYGSQGSIGKFTEKGCGAACAKIKNTLHTPISIWSGTPEEGDKGIKADCSCSYIQYVGNCHHVNWGV